MFRSYANLCRDRHVIKKQAWRFGDALIMKGGKKKNINYNILHTELGKTEMLQSNHVKKEKTVYLKNQEIWEAH